jgi:hypothetical protein
VDSVPLAVFDLVFSLDRALFLVGLKMKDGSLAAGQAAKDGGNVGGVGGFGWVGGWGAVVFALVRRPDSGGGVEGGGHGGMAVSSWCQQFTTC